MARAAAVKKKQQAAPERGKRGELVFTGASSSAFAARRAAVMSALDESAASVGGGRGKWIKFDQEENIFRIAVDPEEPVERPWHIGFWRHEGTGDNGRFMQAVDLGWLSRSEKAREKLGSALTPEDFELIAQYGGDPVRILDQAVQAALGGEKLPDDLKNLRAKPWGKQRYYYTAIKGGVVGVLEQSDKFHKVIEGMVKREDISLDVDDDFDLLVIAEGPVGSRNRRYQSPTIVMRSRGPATYSGGFPDLWAVLKQNVVGFKAKAKFALRSYPEFVEIAGIAPSDLGLAGKDADAFAPSAVDRGRPKARARATKATSPRKRR